MSLNATKPAVLNLFRCHQPTFRPQGPQSKKILAVRCDYDKNFMAVNYGGVTLKTLTPLGPLL